MLIHALHFFNNVCCKFKTIHFYKCVLIGRKLTANIVLMYFSVRCLNCITRVIQHMTHTCIGRCKAGVQHKTFKVGARHQVRQQMYHTKLKVKL